MMELEDRIMGYSVKDLIVVAELMQKKGIDDKELHDFAETYLKGFKDGQEYRVSEFDKTMNSLEQTFEIGDWGKSYRELNNFVPLNEDRVRELLGNWMEEKQE